MEDSHRRNSRLEASSAEPEAKAWVDCYRPVVAEPSANARGDGNGGIQHGRDPHLVNVQPQTPPGAGRRAGRSPLNNTSNNIRIGPT